MKLKLLFLFSILFNYSLFAQPSFQWTKGIGGAGSILVDITSSTIDYQNNVLVCGVFNGTVDFDPGIGTTNLISATTNDIFYGKYSSTGQLIWVKQLIGFTGNNNYSTVFRANSIDTDNAGNIYMVGRYGYNSIDFDPGTNVANLATFTTSNGSISDAFYAKYDNNGNFVFVKRVHTDGHRDELTKIVIDKNNSVARMIGQVRKVTSTNASVRYDNLPANANNSSTEGNLGFYISTDLNGNLLGNQSDDMNYSSEITEIAIDSYGNFCLFSYTSTSQIGGQPSIATLNKFSLNGSSLWDKTFNGILYSDFRVKSMQFDQIGNIYVVGSFKSILDLDPSTSSTFNVTAGSTGSSDASTDGVIAKYNLSGNFVWGGVIGTQAGISEDVNNVIINNDSKIICTGFYKGTVDFNIYAGTNSLTSSPSTANNSFMAYYDLDGNYLWAGNLGNSTAYPIVIELNQSSTGDIYTSGTFKGTQDFDYSSGTTTLTNVSGGSGTNSFIAKYFSCLVAPVQPSSITGTASVCEGGSDTYTINTVNDATSYTWNLPSGWSGTSTTNTISVTFGSNSGVISVTANNACGSSTAQTINVSVNSPSTPTFTQVNPICAGGTLNALPQTSTNSVSGTWSPSLNNAATTTYTFTPASSQCATTQTMTITVNPLPTATINATGSTTVCQGSSVVLNANTGNGLTYQWKNNGSNISGATNSSYTATASGSYTVAVSSNGCSTTSSATIVTVTNNTTPTFTQVNPICAGGTLNALPQTSNNSVSGTWSPALNNASTTTYTFTAASGQCATTQTMTITVNPLPTATINATGSTTVCQGSSVVLNANTGNGLTYQWKNNGSNISGATNSSYTATASGSYTVDVSSNGCTTTSSATTVTVTSNTTPTFTQVSPICTGGTLNPLPQTSNNSVSGTWSPSLNNASTTSYTFTPSTGQCATTQTMTITVNQLPIVTLNQFNSVCDTIGALTLFGGQPTGGVYSGTSVNNNTFNTQVGIGNYPITYSYIDNNGCTANATQSITVIHCDNVGLNEFENENFNIYPNPTTNFVVLNVNESLLNNHYFLIDQNGKIIKSGVIETEQSLLDLNDLVNGIYVLSISDSAVKLKLIKM